MRERDYTVVSVCSHSLRVFWFWARVDDRIRFPLRAQSSSRYTRRLILFLMKMRGACKCWCVPVRSTLTIQQNRSFPFFYFSSKLWIWRCARARCGCVTDDAPVGMHRVVLVGTCFLVQWMRAVGFALFETLFFRLFLFHNSEGDGFTSKFRHVKLWTRSHRVWDKYFRWNEKRKTIFWRKMQRLRAPTVDPSTARSGTGCHSTKIDKFVLKTN